MSRDLNSTLAAELGKPVVRAIFLADFELADETIRVWTGHGTIRFDSNNYLGMGKFGRVSQIDETASDKEVGAAFELSGIPADLLDDFNDADIQGRPCTLDLGALDESMGALVGTPEPIYVGQLDQQQIDDSGQTISITVSSENRSRGQIRSQRRVYSDADHQAEWPGDTFFSQVAALPNTEFVWGRKDITAPGEKGAG